MHISVAALFFSALGCVTAAVASANPADDINQAIRTFAAVKSVHIDITWSEGSGMEDMVAPNKSSDIFTLMGRRIQTVKIGSDRWIKVAGQWKRAQSSSADLTFNIDAAAQTVLHDADVREKYTISDAGMATVGALPAHKYRLVEKDTSNSGDVFIGLDHLPLRIVIDTESGPLTYTYSRYNSVPDFNAPI